MTTVPIRYVEPSGAVQEIAADAGASVMRVALDHGIAGIIAECGGDCACATCHVYVDPAFADRLLPVAAMEDEMLEGVAAERRPTSRLSCQIVVQPDLAGLTVTIPPIQY